MGGNVTSSIFMTLEFVWKQAARYQLGELSDIVVRFSESITFLLTRWAGLSVGATIRDNKADYLLPSIAY